MRYTADGTTVRDEKGVCVASCRIATRNGYPYTQEQDEARAQLIATALNLTAQEWAEM